MATPNYLQRSFVAGATGYTGRAVLAALGSQGREAVAHVRPDSAAALPDAWSQPPLGVDRSLWQAAALRGTLLSHAPTCIFALLGTTRRRAQAQGMAAAQAYAQIDRDLTLMLYAAACALPQPPLFIYLSALGVNAASRSPYLAVRGEVEQTLVKGPLPYVIARPAFLTGTDRQESRPAERIAAYLLDTTLGALAHCGARSLAQRYASMDATTMAAALVVAAQTPGVWRSVLEAGQLRELASALIGKS